MAKEEASALKPGKKLTWKAGSFGRICAREEGEEVEFVRYDQSCDMHGLPMIIVKTKRGEKSFSCFWFNFWFN